MEALGINGWMLLAQIVNFVAVIIVLRLVAYDPIRKMLNERQQRIEKGLEDARAAAESRAHADQEREDLLATAREESRGLVAASSKEAQQVRDEIVSHAQVEAQRILDQARSDAQREKERVLARNREEITAIAIAATNHLLGEALDERRQRALVASFFNGIQEDRVPILEMAPQGRTGEVVIVSAVPLTDDEQAKITAELRRRLDQDRPIEFRIDPSLLGGLVLRMGNYVVDDSMAGKLQQLERAVG